MLHFAAKYNKNREIIVQADSIEVDEKWDNISHKISTVYCENTWNLASTEGYTPAHVAAHYGNNAFIQYIIENVKNGKDYVLQPTQNIRKMNVLHICAEQSISSLEENQTNENKYPRQYGLVLYLYSN